MYRHAFCDVIWCNLAVGQDVQQGGGPWEKPQDRSSRKRGGELTVPISHLSPPQATFRASVCPPLLVLAQCLTDSEMHHPLILHPLGYSSSLHPRNTDLNLRIKGWNRLIITNKQTAMHASVCMEACNISLINNIDCASISTLTDFIEDKLLLYQPYYIRLHKGQC